MDSGIDMLSWSAGNDMVQPVTGACEQLTAAPDSCALAAAMAKSCDEVPPPPPLPANALSEMEAGKGDGHGGIKVGDPYEDR